MPGKLALAAALILLNTLMFANVAHADRVKARVKIGDVKVSVGSGHGKARHYRRDHRNNQKSVHRNSAFKCIAVARRRGGHGRRVQNIMGTAVGSNRRSCRQAALRRCYAKLKWRQKAGRNRAAECVIERRVVQKQYR